MFFLASLPQHPHFFSSFFKRLLATSDLHHCHLVTERELGFFEYQTAFLRVYILTRNPLLPRSRRGALISELEAEKLIYPWRRGYQNYVY